VPDCVWKKFAQISPTHWLVSGVPGRVTRHSEKAAAERLTALTAWHLTVRHVVFSRARHYDARATKPAF